MAKKLMSSPKLINVSVGDRVRAHFGFPFDRDNREVIGLVMSVQRRYGHYGNFVRTSPLLKVMTDGKGESKYFDQSYVVEVLDRYNGPKRPAENLFRQSPPPWFMRPLKRGVWQGTLTGVTCHVLARLDVHITHSLDVDKLKKLFLKDRPGLITNDFGLVVVKAERFKRWVKKNYSKFLSTTAELDVEYTKQNEAEAIEMEADMDLFDRLYEERREESDRSDSSF